VSERRAGSAGYKYCKEKDRDDEGNGSSDMEYDICLEPSLKTRKIIDDTNFQNQILKNFSSKCCYNLPSAKNF
jgi:hypothetical protein